MDETVAAVTSQAPFPWQQQIWQKLVARLQADSLPHALIFSGQAGLGKSSFAQQFTLSLLCEQVLSSGAACGQCRQCSLAIKGNHPDYLTLQPETKQITVEQIRELNNSLQQAKHVAQRKLAVIFQAEKMNLAAANAFLKTLEEPNTGVQIILVSAKPQALPATILSRCQIFHFKAPNLDNDNLPGLIDWVQQNIPAVNGLAPTDIETLLRLVHYAPLCLAETELTEFLSQRQQWLQQLLGFLQRNSSPINLAEQWKNLPSLQLFLFLQEVIADLIKQHCFAQNDASNNYILYRNFATDLQQLGKCYSMHNLYKIWDHLSDFRNKINKNANLNLQLMLEELLICMQQLKEVAGEQCS